MRNIQLSGPHATLDSLNELVVLLSSPQYSIQQKTETLFSKSTHDHENSRHFKSKSLSLQLKYIEKQLFTKGGVVP